MRYYVKEWYDKTASLISEDGYVLETFPSTDDAVNACIEHCLIEPDFVEKLSGKFSCHYVEQPHRPC